MQKLIEKYTNEHSKFVEVNGLKVHYRDEGEGKTILLIHGIFATLHTWDEWVNQLSGEFRLLRPTLPPTGLTGPMPNGTNYSTGFYVDFLKQFIDKVGIDKCHVCGNSSGGWIAWEFALKYPEVTNKLILIGAAGFVAKDKMPLPMKLAKVPFVRDLVKLVIRRAFLRFFLRQVYVDREKITTNVIDRYYELLTGNGTPEALIKVINSEFEDNTGRLDEIKASTLVVWGRKDTWIPVEDAFKFQQRIPNARVLIYDNMGHVPMEEHPNQTAMDARSFLVNYWG